MINSVFFDELYKQYNWYDSIFTPVVKNCSNEFFFDGFEYKLASISTNMNVLAQNETFFVTKVKINSKNDVYIRISQEAINVILDKVLGKNNRKFELTEVSELEARIVTAFNDFLYESLAPNFTIDPQRRYNEILHLTYFVKSESSDNAAKFIISVPKDILSPQNIDTSEVRFNDMDFASSLVEVNLILGSTTFPVADIKKLDIGDIVVFENSKSSEMTLVCDNIIQKFQVKPNIKIIEPYDMGGGSSMSEDANTNLWDSIQVDMMAEFDKVKVTLGELKSIEEGLIVDLCSVYDNKVSLKVGGKVVAMGELVIINDRFGVRIEKVSDSNSSADSAAPEIDEPSSENSEENHEGEDFDYSDFEVDENQG
ncbi:FliM/FliN family flagellar motor switch protein [bacterium]|nr:FliM/FliN family flagellar motor switch protein [bacterium]MBR1776778.1 FliM/FliN family flagellar motor switch protein [bacterium]